MSASRMRLVLSTGLASTLMATAPAFAQQIAPSIDVPAAEVETVTQHAGPVYTFGLGAGFAPDYEGSDDYKAVPLWNLRAGNLYHPDTYVQLFGPLLRSNFLPDEHWRLGIAGRFIPERDDVDDNKVDDLKSVDASLFLGAMAGYDFLAGRQQDLSIMLNAMQDVASDNGFLGTIQGSYATALNNRTRLSLGVETTWASEDYMSSYFGIDANDAARSGLDRYNADEGFKDVALGASLSHAFSESWSVSVLGRYARLLNDAKDSPIVDDEGDANQFFAGVLANFTF
jgi:outer membrane protein